MSSIRPYSVELADRYQFSTSLPHGHEIPITHLAGHQWNCTCGMYGRTVSSRRDAIASAQLHVEAVSSR